MIWAVASVVVGLVGFLVPIPIALPVIGLAAGANGFLWERKKAGWPK